MRLAIDGIKDTNFGDHGERVRTSHAHIEGETVEDLVARVLDLNNRWSPPGRAGDEVVIRVIVEPEQETTPVPVDSSF